MKSLCIPSSNIYLQPLSPEDATDLHTYRNIPEISRYQSWRPQSLEEVQHFIQNNPKQFLDAAEGWIQLGIYQKASEKMLGDCGVHVIDSALQQVEFGITLAPSSQGQGFATEAIQALFKELFEQHNVHRIFASVDPRNRPSMMLMERLGMRQEAHFIQSLFFKGEWVDDVHFAMLRTEWVSKQAVT